MFIVHFCRIWEQCLETPCTVAGICDEIGFFRQPFPAAAQHNCAWPDRLSFGSWATKTRRQRVAEIYRRGGKQDSNRPPRMSEHESYPRAKDRMQARELHRAFSFFPLADAA